MGKQRLKRVFDATIAEVAQKRVACAQRQKRQTGALTAEGLRKEAVHDLVGSAITADCDKVSDAARKGRACNFGRISGGASLGDLNFEATGFEAFERRSQEFAAATAAGGGIHDCEMVLAQSRGSKSLR